MTTGRRPDGTSSEDRIKLLTEWEELEFISTISTNADNVTKIKQRMNEILLKHTGQTLTKIEEDTDRDNFMSAEEAKSYGLIDKVLEHLPHLPPTT